MFLKYLKSALVISTVTIFLPSCATISDTVNTSETTSASAKSAGSENEDSKSDKKDSKTLSHTFTAPLTDTHTAALAAAKINGFNLTKNDELQIEGYRPNKMGLITVGSGGEKIFVSLSEIDPMTTQVEVLTKKTFVGFVGQKDWSDEIIDLMKSELE